MKKSSTKSRKLISFHRFEKKKGMIALDSLIGVVLSVIALFFVVQFIFDILLNTPENQNIAYSDAQSIVDFVDSSFQKYKVYNNCYTMLKLSNLENFQFDEGDSKKNYFYVIGPRKDEYGVYVIPISYLPQLKSQLKESKGFSGIKVNKFIAFSEKDFELKYDVTTDDKLTISMWGNKFNDLSDDVDLSDDEVKYIFLTPKLNKDVLGFEISFMDSDDNILIGETLVYNPNPGHGHVRIQDRIPDGSQTKSSINNYDYELSRGFYLGFSPSTKEIFLTKSHYSNMFLKYKSCLTKQYGQYDYDKYMKDSPEKADYFNYELIFDLVNPVEGAQDLKFVWKGGIIECPTKFGHSCEDYFGENYNSLEYEQFLEKLNGDVLKHKDFTGKEGEYGKYGFKLLETRKLDIDEIESIQDGTHYKYENIFIRSNVDNLNSDNVKDVLRAEYDKGNFYHSFLKHRVDKDSCKSSYCDYIGFKNSVPYFYDEELKDFVFVNTKLFRVGENNDVYFEGKKLKTIERSFDDVGISWFEKNKGFFLFNINTEKGERTILMSPYLLTNIKQRENYKSSSGFEIEKELPSGNVLGGTE